MTTTSVSRPGGITALSVLTIVLGLLGLLTGLMALVGLLFQAQMQLAVANLQPDAEAKRVQLEAAEEAEQIAQQHVVRNWIIAAIRLSVATALFLGGIWSLSLKPIGRITLLAAFGVAIPFEAFQLWPAWEARNLSTHVFAKMVEAQQQGKPNAPPDFDATMKIMAQAMATVQLVIMAGMFLAKSGFYGFGLWYLTRPRVAGLFVRPKPPDPQWT